MPDQGRIYGVINIADPNADQLQATCPALGAIFAGYYAKLSEHGSLTLSDPRGRRLTLRLIPTNCRHHDIRIEVVVAGRVTSVVELAHIGQARFVDLATTNRLAGWKWLLTRRDDTAVLLDGLAAINSWLADTQPVPTALESVLLPA